ncbi:U-box domain-containing protein 9-like isoform X1 [Lycium barbarum]|uniref:U-box domain-containing protein 9-like isoform X1 n=2 Tax=Lycium barbarum TaxID=112863 RepID=UPI00293E6FEE|nr:U-box domain-containing protein 9-like isoform X1 [Lycium barbarum]XP_060184102.1 U-box domain-containing protein 9-like isoform X1 [Lycium barbarum]
MAKISELKRELQRAVNCVIEEDDDDSLEATDQAMQCLCALKDLKLKSLSLPITPPHEFVCPLSKQLIKDPVVLASGQTYDRPFIQKWLKDGNRTCPETKQVLSHSALTPNHLVRKMISQWCLKHKIELPGPSHDEDQDIVTNADRDRLNSLLETLSSSNVPEQKKAAKEVRVLTKQMPSLRAVFGECSDAVNKLLSPLLSGNVNSHPDLQEDLITTVLNISIHDSNKKLVAENPIVIPLLIESLKFGTLETRRNSAATLFTLSALDSNKDIIGKAGAFKPLVELLDDGQPLAMKDAASAIFNLSIVHENKGKAVSEGTIKVIMKKIEDRILIDELLAILALLSTHHKAIEEMGELGAVFCLLSIIKEDTSDRNKENCIAILYTMCYNDRTKLKEIWIDESTNGTIANLAQSGTSRAKRKANGIIERLDRYLSLVHTA